MNNLNKNLKKYVESEIISQYSNFDEGHDTRHVYAVIERSFDYYTELKDKINLDVNIIYVVAAYHDVGISINRNGHAKHSKSIVLNDKKLGNWFSNEELLLIAEACEDHSTSSNNTPRSIYGKIVSDADKDTDIIIGLKRGWDFSKKYYPNLSFDERIDEVHAEIVKRFGDESIGGKSLVKFYISSKKNSAFMKQMIKFAYDKNAYKEKMLEILDKSN